MKAAIKHNTRVCVAHTAARNLYFGAAIGGVCFYASIFAECLNARPQVRSAHIQVSSTEQQVRIVDLPTANAKTNVKFKSVLGIREVSGGSVLVNDARGRQLLMFDTTLAFKRIVFDSMPGLSNSYGSFGVPLVRYTGDSSLMADVETGQSTLLVLDGSGNIARSLALPNPDASEFMSAMSGLDDRGRLVYAAGNRIRMPKAGTVGPQELFVDSIPVLRADLDARRVDTIGRVSKNKGEYSKIDHTEANKIVRTLIINPLPSPDEWAVLTDGSVAFIRGHDYHIDWLRSDGTTSSSPRLPFDWKRLTDQDKQKLIDSANAVHAAQNAFAIAARKEPPPPRLIQSDGSGSTRRSGNGAGITQSAYDPGGNLWVPLTYEVVAPSDIPDYWPAIRQGAAKADFENHLWILPTTSAQSRNGELAYDMVNSSGDLFQRVRLPAGREIAGFGKAELCICCQATKPTGFISNARDFLELGSACIRGLTVSNRTRRIA